MTDYLTDSARLLLHELDVACHDDTEDVACQDYIASLIKSKHPGHLIETLANSDEMHRRLVAIDLIRRTRPSSAVRQLAKLANADSDVEVQGRAAEALGEFRSRRAATALVRGLHSGDRGKRNDTIMALARQRLASAVPELDEVASYLERSGDARQADLARAASAYISNGLDGLRTLLDSDGSATGLARSAAAIAKVSGDLTAVEMLIGFVDSSDDDLRNAALNSLVQLNVTLKYVGTNLGQMVSAAVARALPGTVNFRSKALGVSLLGVLRDASSLPVLSELAENDPSDRIRLRARQALVRLGNESR